MRAHRADGRWPPLTSVRAILAFTFIFLSAGSADRTAGHVAGFGLMFVMGLLALREEEPFVDMMIDEVPREQFVMGKMTRDVEVGVGEARVVSRLAPKLSQFAPDVARLIASLGAQMFENSTDAAVATGNQSLKVGLARRFGVKFNGGAGGASQFRAQHRDFALEHRGILHRIPLEGCPRLWHERVERYGDAANMFFLRACLGENSTGEMRNFEQVLVMLLGQADHKIELQVLDPLTQQQVGGLEDFRLGQILVDYLAHPLAARLGRDGHAVVAVARKRRGQLR